jgi:hypothetical protein
VEAEMSKPPSTVAEAVKHVNCNLTTTLGRFHEYIGRFH